MSENLARIAPVFDSHGQEITIKTKTKVVYEAQESGEKLHFPKVSSLNKEKPQYVLYQEIYATESNVVDRDTGEVIGKKTKHYMKNCTKVDNVAWLLQLCAPALLSHSSALTKTDLPQLKDESLADYMQASKNFEKKEDAKRLVRTFYGREKWPLGLVEKNN